ncbi:DUF2336 domain-containing protein [Pelagibius sp. CAU 1746]|uniref:DUF2336 domain-containing protein n=1 Tax=Pelagibius sp. CAU 1746 TaxID=3140370 RepID=UPI00325A6F50
METAAGSLGPDDLQSAFTLLDGLGRFFGAFAERETNSLARDRWRRLSANYQGTAEILRGLLAGGGLILDDLPPGHSSGLLDDKRIVIDRDLDGRWRQGAEQLRDELVPVLMQGLARRSLSQDWPWLADHLRAVGGLAKLAEDPLARPLLARFFQAKDAYIWLAMQRIAQGDPAARRAIARRQVAVFETVRALRIDMAATFGPQPVERLQHDWESYVAQVDGFAATRGWLLLDPALRRTQLGTAAQADAVDRAASEVVAAAPRSALAAARGGLGLPPEESRPSPVPEPAAPGISLGELAARANTKTAADGLKPEPPPAPSAAATQTAAEPDPQRLLSEREAELETARQELTALDSRVGDLDAALKARDAETARLEAELADQRARLGDAERRAAAQAASAESLSAEVRELTALKDRLAGLERQLAARGEEAQHLATALAVERARLAQAEAAARAQPAAAQASAIDSAVPADQEAEPAVPESSGLHEYRLLIFIAFGVILLLGFLLWQRSRRRFGAVDGGQGPVLLVPLSAEQAVEDPVAARQAVDLPDGVAAAEPAPAVVSEPAPAPDRSADLPRLRPGPGEGVRIKVSGVPPLTPEARAAMRAGAIKAQAAEAAAQGREAAAAGDPMVQALRKGNLPLFELLFAEMTGLRAPHLQRVVYGGQGEDLLVVCRAVGIEKLLFGSIFLLTDPLRGGDADEDPARAAEVLRMYDRLPQPIARKVLAKWRETWGEGTPRQGEPFLG